MVYFWVRYRHKSNPSGYRLIYGSRPDFDYFAEQGYSWVLSNSFFTSESDALTHATDQGWTVLSSQTGFDAYNSS
jgi:hypothetical protein